MDALLRELQGRQGHKLRQRWRAGGYAAQHGRLLLRLRKHVRQICFPWAALCSPDNGLARLRCRASAQVHSQHAKTSCSPARLAAGCQVTI